MLDLKGYKMFDIINKLRKTLFYKIGGWTGCVIAILLFLMLYSIGKLQGLGAILLGLVLISSIVIINIIYLVVFIVCIIGAFIQIKIKKLTQKTNIIADIGYIIVFIFIFFIGIKLYCHKIFSLKL